MFGQRRCAGSCSQPGQPGRPAPAGPPWAQVHPGQAASAAALLGGAPRSVGMRMGNLPQPQHLWVTIFPYVRGRLHCRDAHGGASSTAAPCHLRANTHGASISALEL